jgi:hypothetical protein
MGGVMENQHDDNYKKVLDAIFDWEENGQFDVGKIYVTRYHASMLYKDLPLRLKIVSAMVTNIDYAEVVIQKNSIKYE